MLPVRLPLRRQLHWPAWWRTARSGTRRLGERRSSGECRHKRGCQWPMRGKSMACRAHREVGTTERALGPPARPGRARYRSSERNQPERWPHCGAACGVRRWRGHTMRGGAGMDTHALPPGQRYAPRVASCMQWMQCPHPWTGVMVAGGVNCGGAHGASVKCEPEALRARSCVTHLVSGPLAAVVAVETGGGGWHRDRRGLDEWATSPTPLVERPLGDSRPDPRDTCPPMPHTRSWMDSTPSTPPTPDRMSCSTTSQAHGGRHQLLRRPSAGAGAMLARRAQDMATHEVHQLALAWRERVAGGV